MTAIFCSNKLKSLIGPEDLTQYSEEVEPSIGGWNAHLFSVDKRKCLAFTNNKCYYTVFITDILKKDLKKINELFTTRLIQQLLFDNVITLRHIPLIKEVQDSIILSRTNNDKKTIGTMNDFIYQFKVHKEYKYESLYDMDVIKENSLINDTPTRPKNKPYSNYGKPKTDMKEIIETYAQHSSKGIANIYH